MVSRRGVNEQGAFARLIRIFGRVTATSDFGVPDSANALRLVLLGSGELGREVAIEAQRLGCEVVAVDRYPGAPAQRIANRWAVIDMTDASQLRALIDAERARPCSRLLVVPEIEAIATGALVELEAEGVEVVPTAAAARLTMDREGIRRLAAEELGLPTSPYRFCDTEQDLIDAVAEIGTPCVVKPVMSSSGKGQSVISSPDGVSEAWMIAQQGGRVGAGRVIVEGFVEFDYEITLLTVRHAGGTSFCAPIGHIQEDGDYRESWQPQPMESAALLRAREIAESVTGALGGRGIFGVELFVRGNEVIFSEVSPRPHDTGMVTMATQNLSEFALHVRAILGLPVPSGEVPLRSPGASAVVLSGSELSDPVVSGLSEALVIDPESEIRLFGKPEARPGRRMGVVLSCAADIGVARQKATEIAARLIVG